MAKICKNVISDLNSVAHELNSNLARDQKTSGHPGPCYINVREYATRVFLPQPKKLDLEITGSSFQKCYTSHSHCAVQTTPPPCWFAWKRKGYK